MTSPTKAFVYAAGLGTRLRPYTLETPKPMLEVFGRPLVLYVLAGLARAGVRHATVNVAWLADAFAGLPEAAAPLGVEVALSVQERPLMHGGDLAHATAFLAGLAPDEVFLAVNGDTIVEYDAPALARLAASVGPAEPLLILGAPSDEGALRASPDGSLVGIGDVDYESPGRAEARWDDLGLRLVHASVRDFLPPAGTEMSLHGAGGLIGRLATGGRRARVAAAPALARAEIGTLVEYDGRASNAALRELANRLIPPSESRPG